MSGRPKRRYQKKAGTSNPSARPPTSTPEPRSELQEVKDLLVAMSSSLSSRLDAVESGVNTQQRSFPSQLPGTSRDSDVVGPCSNAGQLNAAEAGDRSQLLTQADLTLGASSQPVVFLAPNVLGGDQGHIPSQADSTSQLQMQQPQAGSSSQPAAFPSIVVPGGHQAT